MNENRKVILAALLASLKDSGKVASDEGTRKRLIRLASSDPEARAHILPLLLEGSSEGYGPHAARYASLSAKLLKLAQDRPNKRSDTLPILRFAMDGYAEAMGKQAAGKTFPMAKLFGIYVTKKNIKDKSERTGETVSLNTVIQQLQEDGYEGMSSLKGKGLGVYKQFMKKVKDPKTGEKFIRWLTGGKKSKGKAKAQSLRAEKKTKAKVLKGKGKLEAINKQTGAKPKAKVKDTRTKAEQAASKMSL